MSIVYQKKGCFKKNKKYASKGKNSPSQYEFIVFFGTNQMLKYIFVYETNLTMLPAGLQAGCYIWPEFLDS